MPSLFVCVCGFPTKQAAGVYHQVKSEIDIHVNYGSGCPNIVRCYGYFYDEKRRVRTIPCVNWQKNLFVAPPFPASCLCDMWFPIDQQ